MIVAPRAGLPSSLTELRLTDASPPVLSNVVGIVPVWSGEYAQTKSQGVRVTTASPVPTVRAKTSGELAPGASRSRFMLTTGGVKQVKFLRRDGEGPHALANEYVANRILQYLGASREGLCLVELPEALRNAVPELSGVTCLKGLGLDWLRLPLDLTGPQIAATAERSPDAELFAQYLVLEWIQSNDHRGKNFLCVDHDRVVAIDFAGSPGEEQWRCHPFDGPDYDHGGLAERVRRTSQSAREAVLAAFDRVDADTLRRIVEEMPREWGSPDDCDRMIKKLVARKEEVHERYARN